MGFFGEGKAYDDFILDLDFKNAPGTNSGVVVYASNTEEWIPHSVEIQIADDFSDEWTCKGRMIWVALNGELVNTCDMSLYTSAQNNIDGTKAPGWLSNPMATLPLRGYIGLQVQHAGAPIYFRNIKVKELK